MGNAGSTGGPTIVERAAERLAGLGRTVSSSDECKQLWHDSHEALGEAAGRWWGSAEGVSYYGLCTCPEAGAEGAFQYTAAVSAPEAADIPPGLSEFVIPAGKYARFHVAGLHEIGQEWQRSRQWLEEHQEWEGYCDGAPGACGCIGHPSFEHYPPSFTEQGGLFILVPIKEA